MKTFKLSFVAALLGLLLPLAVSSSAALAQSPVNLNSADAATLAKAMDGVGMSKAQAIVDYRNKNGPFRSLDDLALVKGIGPRTIELNRAKVVVGPAPNAKKPAGNAPPVATAGKSVPPANGPTAKPSAVKK